MALCTVLNHLADVPPTVRRAAAILSQAVTKRFSPDDNTGERDIMSARAHVLLGTRAAAEDCVLVAVGGMFFLRFVSPAFALACSSAPQNAAYTLKARALVCVSIVSRVSRDCAHVQQVAKVLQAVVSTSDLRKEASESTFDVRVSSHMGSRRTGPTSICPS